MLRARSRLRALPCVRLCSSAAERPFPSRDEWYGRKAGSLSEPDMGGDALPTGLAGMRIARQKDIANLEEVKQRNNFLEQLRMQACDVPESESTFESSGMTKQDCMTVLTAAFATFNLHAESRVASSTGHGFYTIGPCGEELMAAVGAILRPGDAMALHYRHLAAQVARQLMAGRDIDEILLDRARGHTVSRLDPVTGASHCAIGGGKLDFLVSSTLASQGPPAVGRALGGPLAHVLGVPTLFDKECVSFVSVGDGSVNNAHFLSAVNTAEYAKYRQFKCPMVFAISDNDLCISLKGYGWLRKEFAQKLRMPVYEAGPNMFDVWTKTKAAVDRARKFACPVTIIYRDVPRRFGHAATDRQDAYLTREEIKRAAESNPLAGACAQAVQAGVTTYEELEQLFVDVRERTIRAFDLASQEPKLSSREELLDRVAQPLVQVKLEEDKDEEVLPPKLARQPMRKHMTRVFDELMRKNPSLVYIGEDVCHGGYYLVTEGLAKKYPRRVVDFPPDETSLIGAAIGYSQAGLLPVVEIPYAKYLDCGADQFFEAAAANWFSNGKQPNGLLVRLQGFDRGVFGGNYHTHNSVYLPPGLDVVCYSNGQDYARGMRYAMEQVKAGRVVMSVDSTNLLNMRHLHGLDDALRLPYTKSHEVLPWDEVISYGSGKRVAIVSYGNGVMAARQARQELVDHGVSDITVLDTPLLSDIPTGLEDVIASFEHVVFADVCKEGQHPYAGMITRLQNKGLLPAKWRCVAAQRTYNPLGSVLTFTSKDDIIESCLSVMNE